jgi:hypothetical protein
MHVAAALARSRSATPPMAYPFLPRPAAGTLATTEGSMRWASCPLVRSCRCCHCHRRAHPDHPQRNHVCPAHPITRVELMSRLCLLHTAASKRVLQLHDMPIFPVCLKSGAITQYLDQHSKLHTISALRCVGTVPWCVKGFEQLAARS